MRSLNQMRSMINVPIHSNLSQFFFLLSFHSQSQERGGRRRHGGPAALGDGSHVNAASATSYLHQRREEEGARGNEWTDRMLCMSIFVCLRRDDRLLYVTLRKSKNAVVFLFPSPSQIWRPLGARGFYIEALSLYLGKVT